MGGFLRWPSAPISCTFLGGICPLLFHLIAKYYAGKLHYVSHFPPLWQFYFLQSVFLPPADFSPLPFSKVIHLRKKPEVASCYSFLGSASVAPPQHLSSSTIIFYASLERKWAWTSPPTNTILLKVHAELSGRPSLECYHVPMSLVSNYWHHSLSNSKMLLSLSYVYQGSIAILTEIVNSFLCPPYKYKTINEKNTNNY